MNKEIEELRQQLEQKKEELRKLELSCLDVCQENTALEDKLAQAHEKALREVEKSGWPNEIEGEASKLIRKWRWELYDACGEIELLPASPQQTKVVGMVRAVALAMQQYLNQMLL